MRIIMLSAYCIVTTVLILYYAVKFDQVVIK